MGDDDDLRGVKFRIKVSIIGAANLRSADFNLLTGGKSDPYCIAGLVGRPDTEIKTETIMKTLEPEWKFEGVIPKCKYGDAIEFKVMDYDAIGADDLLGYCELAFDQIYPEPLDDELVLKDEEGKIAKGKTGDSMIRLKVSAERLPSDVQDTRCFVNVIKAEGLRSADWSLSGGKSDPYCIVTVPSKPQCEWRTRVMFKELNPQWSEEDEIFQYEEGDNLEFSVLDYDVEDADDLLGSCTLQNSDFHPNGFEGPLNLGEGTLYVKISVTVPVVVEEVIDPGEHVGPRDREPAPFHLRSMDTGKVHRLVAYTRIGRSKKMLEDPIDLILDNPGINDVSRLHAVIKCWRGPDPNVWMARLYDDKGSEGAGQGPGGGHNGGGTTVDGEAVEPSVGSGLEPGNVLRFGVREMWIFERASMHLRSQEAEIACNKASANSAEDPSRMRSFKIPSLAADSALQRCPDWLSLVRVVLECRLEPDEPPCVDCIITQDEVGRTVGRHEAPTLAQQEAYQVQRILRELKIGGTIKLRLSSDPKLLAPILKHLEAHQKALADILEERQEALE